MQFVSKNLIKLDKELSELDLFTLDFIKILKKHSDYVIVSGYVSILLGRARASEDIDIIIPKMGFSKFVKFLEELKENNFYCLNEDKDKDIFKQISQKFAVRFAKNNTVIPNIELKFSKNKIDKITLENSIKVCIREKELIISNLELQIAFKENVLKSPKDIEDAKHLRIIAQNHLNKEIIKKYEVMLNEFY